MSTQLEIGNGETLATIGAVRQHLLQICEHFEAAERRLRRAQVRGDAGEMAAAEAERQEAAGDFHVASMELADLLLLLFRHGIDHRREALRELIMDILEDEIGDIAAAVAREVRP